MQSYRYVIIGGGLAGQRVKARPAYEDVAARLRDEGVDLGEH
jgi:succinate dehydrogenase/fumarate reductase flavoprotein subunit